MSPLLGIALATFLFRELFQVFVIQAIGDRDHPFIEPLVARLAAADEQDRRPRGSKA
jgi:hypothetical protein